jgi:hypothetical protein
LLMLLPLLVHLCRCHNRLAYAAAGSLVTPPSVGLRRRCCNRPPRMENGARKETESARFQSGRVKDRGGRGNGVHTEHLTAIRKLVDGPNRRHV